MAARDNEYGKGPTHGYAAEGLDAAYRKDRERAERELDEIEAGPKAGMGIAADDTDMKNPDGEGEAPAPMTGPRAGAAGPGPDVVGNSRGDGTVDPQGQQAGTEGGQAGKPRLDGEGVPLASAQDRSPGMHPGRGR
jgi:hypothetical protein